MAYCSLWFSSERIIPLGWKECCEDDRYQSSLFQSILLRSDIPPLHTRLSVECVSSLGLRYLPTFMHHIAIETSKVVSLEISTFLDLNPSDLRVPAYLPCCSWLLPQVWKPEVSYRCLISTGPGTRLGRHAV